MILIDIGRSLCLLYMLKLEQGPFAVGISATYLCAGCGLLVTPGVSMRAKINAAKIATEILRMRGFL